MLKPTLLLLALLLPLASTAEVARLDLERDRLAEELDAIVADYTAGALDESEAATALFGTTAASLAYVAAELSTDLAPGSRSDGALDAASGTYSEFAVAAQERLDEALAALEDTRVAVRVQKRFGPFLTLGPRFVGAEEPGLLPAGWLAAAAWEAPQGRGLIGVGYGDSTGRNTTVRLVGPEGREKTFDLRTLPDATRLAVTSFAIEPAPGPWRLELRYTDDENSSDIVQITAP